jgi:O-acetyl-ADP-ribose deacetylase (regulator of RNase III)
MHELIPGFVFAFTGDITTLDVDAVVNAANSTLLGGGGVDGAIHRAAGSVLLEACRGIRETRYPDGLPTGEAVLTTAGKMKSRTVIHTVGPVWHGGKKNEVELLGKAYRNSLDTAEHEGFETIAFPAVSTGVYGFPKELAARIACQTLSQWHSDHPDSPLRVYLVFFSSPDLEICLRQFRECL